MQYLKIMKYAILIYGDLKGKIPSCRICRSSPARRFGGLVIRRQEMSQPIRA